jgi:MATE family multidrug resistance protein
MALGGAVMIIFALGIALFARTIAALYLPATPDTAETGALTALFLRVAAAFQLFDGIQVIGANALRGLKDVRLPMLLASGAYGWSDFRWRLSSVSACIGTGWVSGWAWPAAWPWQPSPWRCASRM